MSFFDFFFPEQAQAAHLRKLAEQGRSQSDALHRQRVREAQERRAQLAEARGLEQRIVQLEQDLGQAGLVIEALLEILESSGTLTREALADRIHEIDARDGVVDGRITPAPPEPFKPRNPWPGSTDR